jgi:hypothetical protein
VANEQPELYAEIETPAEEKPLDRQPPVTCFLPIDYFIHDLAKILVIVKYGYDFGQFLGIGWKLS